MNQATYTKITKSKSYNDASMSLGFRRYLCLPQAEKVKVNVAAYIATGNADVHDYIVAFFGSMTENDYRQYIVTH